MQYVSIVNSTVILSFNLLVLITKYLKLDLRGGVECPVIPPRSEVVAKNTSEQSKNTDEFFKPGQKGL